MNKQKSLVPLAISIAAKCVALDKVKIVTEEYGTGSHAYNPDIRVLRIGNWNKRLVKKSVKHLTERIDQFCNMSTKKPLFYPWLLGNIRKEGIWVYNDMKYDIIAT